MRCDIGHTLCVVADEALVGSIFLPLRWKVVLDSVWSRGGGLAGGDIAQ